MCKQIEEIDRVSLEGGDEKPENNKGDNISLPRYNNEIARTLSRLVMYSFEY